MRIFSHLLHITDSTIGTNQCVLKIGSEYVLSGLSMEYPTTGVSGAVCDTCGKIYKNKRDLVDHLDTHNGDEYCCDLCGNLFSSKRKKCLKVRQKLGTRENLKI